ncbi:hypothetical protein LSAT2_030401 [Lamellibrachia satsuma]|nr:hypothetical protein LSAT2_030401 [Lamellibrachia satsuma]
MTSNVERLCCNMQPDKCLGLRREMDLLVLDPTVLTMVGRYRADVFGVPARRDNDAIQHYAYNQFVLWRHGKLGIVGIYSKSIGAHLPKTGRPGEDSCNDNRASRHTFATRMTARERESVTRVANIALSNSFFLLVVAERNGARTNHPSLSAMLLERQQPPSKSPVPARRSRDHDLIIETFEHRRCATGRVDCTKHPIIVVITEQHVSIYRQDRVIESVNPFDAALVAAPIRNE